MADKMQIHQSMLTQFEGCGEQFRRRYGARFGWAEREEIIPPGVALIVGISTDKAVTANLGNMITEKQPLPLEAVKQIAFDQATGLWQEEVFLQEEETVDIDRTKGESIDMAVALSALHAVEVAPKIQPSAVQEKFVIVLKGYPYDLSGTIDVVENVPMFEIEGEPPNVLTTIRDTKTSGKSPAINAADTSEQLSMYALAKKVQGVPVDMLYLDFLVKNKTPKAVTQKTSRNEHQLAVFMRRMERMIEALDKGVFVPARADDWRCSERFCGYYPTCKFGGGN